MALSRDEHDQLLETIGSWPTQEQIAFARAVLRRVNMQSSTAPSERRSLYGLCRDLGEPPTDTEIDEARHALWADFPRRDIP